DTVCECHRTIGGKDKTIVHLNGDTYRQGKLPQFVRVRQGTRFAGTPGFVCWSLPRFRLFAPRGLGKLASDLHFALRLVWRGQRPAERSRGPLLGFGVVDFINRFLSHLSL